MSNHHHHLNHGGDGGKHPQTVVVMVPFPAQGHLNQLLHLSRLISSYDLPVHYVASAAHNRQAKLRLHGWNPHSATNLHFHELPTPHFLSPPPNPNSSVHFPSHLQPSFDASRHLRRPVADLLRQISATDRRVVVVYDSLMASVVQDAASMPNVESYAFHSVSAFALFFYQWEAMGRPFPVEVETMRLTDLPPSRGCFTVEFEKFIAKERKHAKLNSGRLYNTCRVVEGPCLDLLAKEEIFENKRQWALGPFNPVAAARGINNPNLCRHRCLEWLDTQEPNSVIYVSFGTTTSLTDEQIKELAVGLEKSDQHFIWVLRDADKGNIFAAAAAAAAAGGGGGGGGGGEKRGDDQLPKGFRERVGGRGMLVRDWAPQLEILGHPSTGGFMSHCGWNSCMESITMGVPMAAWPVHSDQPRNTVLVAELLGVGLVVKDWERRDELVTAESVEKAVKRLMASGEGDEIRRRAAALGGAVRESMAEGGGSRRELDSFIAHITRRS